MVLTPRAQAKARPRGNLVSQMENCMPVVVALVVVVTPDTKVVLAVPVAAEPVATLQNQVMTVQPIQVAAVEVLAVPVGRQV